MRQPRECENMAELRVEIDALDRELVALLARRAGYIDRAAELKPGEALPARIPARVEDVVSKVRAAAQAAGLDPDLAERLWRQLIEWSIAREEVVLGPDVPADKA
ncbi:MAG: chorismate mutase [Rhodobacterales bacterium]|nr:MAG: chorismate mutase [Rhodobacterales bacterium]